MASGGVVISAKESCRENNESVMDAIIMLIMAYNNAVSTAAKA